MNIHTYIIYIRYIFSNCFSNCVNAKSNYQNILENTSKIEEFKVKIQLRYILTIAWIFMKYKYYFIFYQTIILMY